MSSYHSSLPTAEDQAGPKMVPFKTRFWSSTAELVWIPATFPINGEPYTLLYSKAEGEFSTVYEATSSDGRKFAVKIQRYHAGDKAAPPPLRCNEIRPPLPSDAMRPIPVSDLLRGEGDYMTVEENTERSRCYNEMEVVRKLKKAALEGKVPLPGDFCDYFVDTIGYNEFVIPVYPAQGPKGEAPKENEAWKDESNRFAMRVFVSVMVWCETSVDRLLAEGTKKRMAFPIHRRLLCALHVAQALAFMHAAGFVHRDIKAGNILFHDGRFKLCDFGISDHSGFQHYRLSSDRSFIYTPKNVSVQISSPSSSSSHLPMHGSSPFSTNKRPNDDTPKSSNNQEEELEESDLEHDEDSEDPFTGEPTRLPPAPILPVPEAITFQPPSSYNTSNRIEDLVRVDIHPPPTNLSSSDRDLLGTGEALNDDHFHSKPSQFTQSYVSSNTTINDEPSNTNKNINDESLGLSHTSVGPDGPSSPPATPASCTDDQLGDVVMWGLVLHQLITMQEDKWYKVFRDKFFNDILKKPFAMKTGADMSMFHEQLIEHLNNEALNYPGLPSLIAGSISATKSSFTIAQLLNSTTFISWITVLDPKAPIDVEKLSLEPILTFLMESDATQFLDADVFDRLLRVLRVLIEKQPKSFWELLKDPDTVTQILNIVSRRLEFASAPPEDLQQPKPLSFSDGTYSLASSTSSQGSSTSYLAHSSYVRPPPTDEALAILSVDALFITQSCLAHLERSCRYGELRTLQRSLLLEANVVNVIKRVFRLRPTQPSPNDKRPNSQSSSPLRPDQLPRYVASTIAVLLCVRNHIFTNKYFGDRGQISIDNMDCIVRFAFHLSLSPHPDNYPLLLLFSVAHMAVPYWFAHSTLEKEKVWVAQLFCNLVARKDKPSDVTSDFVDFYRIFLLSGYDFDTTHITQFKDKGLKSSLRSQILRSALPSVIKLVLQNGEELQELHPNTDWPALVRSAQVFMLSSYSFQNHTWNRSARSQCLSKPIFWDPSFHSESDALRVLSTASDPSAFAATGTMTHNSFPSAQSLPLITATMVGQFENYMPMLASTTLPTTVHISNPNGHIYLGGCPTVQYAMKIHESANFCECNQGTTVAGESFTLSNHSVSPVSGFGPIPLRMPSPDDDSHDTSDHSSLNSSTRLHRSNAPLLVQGALPVDPSLHGKFLCLFCAEAYHLVCAQCGRSNMTLTLVAEGFECKAPRTPTFEHSTCYGYQEPPQSRLDPHSHLAKFRVDVTEVSTYNWMKMWPPRSPGGKSAFECLDLPPGPVSPPPLFTASLNEVEVETPRRIAKKGTLQHYVEIKVVESGRTCDVFLGVTGSRYTKKSVYLNHGKLKSWPQESPYLGYNAADGNLVYTAFVGDTVELRSRPYGPPVESSQHLGLGITSDNEIFFVVGDLVLPNVNFDQLPHFYKSDHGFIPEVLAASKRFLVTLNPTARFQVCNYWDGQLSRHLESPNDSPTTLRLALCPLSHDKLKPKEVSQRLEKMDQFLSLVEPSWLAAVLKHFNSSQVHVAEESRSTPQGPSAQRPAPESAVISPTTAHVAGSVAVLPTSNSSSSSSTLPPPQQPTPQLLPQPPQIGPSLSPQTSVPSSAAPSTNMLQLDLATLSPAQLEFFLKAMAQMTAMGAPQVQNIVPPLHVSSAYTSTLPLTAPPTFSNQLPVPDPTDPQPEPSSSSAQAAPNAAAAARPLPEPNTVSGSALALSTALSALSLDDSVDPDNGTSSIHDKSFMSASFHDDEDDDSAIR